MNMMHWIMALMPGNISCKEFDEKLDEYIEGELTAWNRFRMGLHKVICRACALYAAGYRRTIDIIKSSIDYENVPAADEPVSEELVQNIVQKQLESSGQ